jgi:hypothetical protein
MRILKILSKFFVCILCACVLCAPSFAETNVPLGDIGEYGNWITEDNMETINHDMAGDAIAFQKTFTNNATNIESSNFIPIEVRIGLMFMKALSSIDYVLQISLVRFTIMFLFIMYALWIALEAYKMSRESSDYKTVLYDVFKKGITIAVWVLILNYGPTKIFMAIISPILALSTYISDFILESVAQAHGTDFQNTCDTIRRFVAENAATPIANNESATLMIDANGAANIMCLPGRLSTYFYHATGTAFKWFTWGFGIGHPTTAIVMGAICVVIFVRCIFKYAFMTLGVVADLFLTLLMLPFTALAEALPSTSEKSYVGKILSGFLSIFNTKKLSDVISVFVNAAIYFVSLAIVIAICAGLLDYVIPNISNNSQYALDSAMITILCGCLILYLANKADDLAKKVGGSINNSFGKQLQGDVKTLWGDTKKVAGKIYQDWLKKK